MYITKFTSGHPVGSSLDPSGPSGLTHTIRRASQYDYFLPQSDPANGGDVWLYDMVRLDMLLSLL